MGKAKQGLVIYRVRVRRGGRKRPVHKGIVNGKPVNQGVGHLKPKRNQKNIAEEKDGRRCGGLRVLNSYWVNGQRVQVLRGHPGRPRARRRANDPRLNWICNPTHKHRELRGLTSAGKKYRGLHGKGHLYDKARPSVRAVWKK